jgi:hypothetical protein
MIAKVLGIAKATVCWHCKQHRVNAISRVSNGRPPILCHAGRDDLVQCITTGYAECQPWEITEIKDQIESTYRKRMEANPIRHMLRSEPHVKACRGVPMEESRLAVSPDDIKAYFHRLVTSCTGLLRTLFLLLMRRVIKSGRIAKESRVTYHQNTLVMKFPSLFRGQARESLMSLVSALTDPF